MPTLEQHILKDLYELEYSVKETLEENNLFEELILLEDTIKKLEYFIVNNENKSSGI